MPLCGGWGVIWKNNLPVLALFTEGLAAYKPPQCPWKYHPGEGSKAPCDTNHLLKHSRCAGVCNPSKRALGLCKLLQQWQDWNLLPVHLKVSSPHHKVWLTRTNQKMSCGWQLKSLQSAFIRLLVVTVAKQTCEEGLLEVAAVGFYYYRVGVLSLIS